MPKWRNGRRTRLKILRGQLHVGSTPTFGTKRSSVYLFKETEFLILGEFMKNIIVVDMQNGFINENNKHLVEKIKNYLNSNKFENIFFTKCVNDKQSPFTKILHWDGLQNKYEEQITLTPPPNSIIITKTGYGLDNDSIELIKKCNISEIEICGTDTDACCLAIAFNMFDNGIKPIILSELCASSSSNKSIHKNAIEIMQRQFGKENVK